jgi:hypothetical protein
LGPTRTSTRTRTSARTSTSTSRSGRVRRKPSRDTCRNKGGSTLRQRLSLTHQRRTCCTSSPRNLIVGRPRASWGGRASGRGLLLTLLEWPFGSSCQVTLRWKMQAQVAPLAASPAPTLQPSCLALEARPHALQALVAGTLLCPSPSLRGRQIIGSNKYQDARLSCDLCCCVIFQTRVQHRGVYSLILRTYASCRRLLRRANSLPTHTHEAICLSSAC